MKIAPSFSAIDLCFVVNVLNNKTITTLNLAGHRLNLANSANSLVGLVLGDIPCDSQKNCFKIFFRNLLTSFRNIEITKTLHARSVLSENFRSSNHDIL